jgi:hypothetical protein
MEDLEVKKTSPTVIFAPVAHAVNCGKSVHEAVHPASWPMFMPESRNG